MKFLPERLAILLLGIAGYGLTMARSLSFWDCGEFIAASSVLGIPHPTGYPLFVLLGRVFILLFGWINGPAFAVNLISAASAVLCCLLIFEITIKILPKELDELIYFRRGLRGLLGFFAASISLFGDTFWFNAVEAGAYATSMLIIMLQIWAALKWKETASGKYLVFIAYIAFLGLGFHTFCLLPLPAIFLFAIFACLKRRRQLLGIAPSAAAAALLIAIGLSAQLYLPIRSSTEPALNEYNPAKLENFIEVLGRKQYGSMNMFERALYRRAYLLNQFGFSDNIGYLGYHLNQWVPAPMGAQMPGAWGASAQERLQFAHRIVFEFLIIAVFAGAWVCRRNSGVVLASMMFFLSSAGLALYLNMADGFKPESYNAKMWNKQTKELREYVPDSIPNLPSIEKLNSLLSFYYALPGEKRGMWLENALEADGLRTLFAWEDALNEQDIEMANPPRAVRREVRNRDYFFVPAFLFFACMAAAACGAGMRRMRPGRAQKLAACALALAWLVPFACNFSSHNRSKDFIARNFAMNLLSSVPHGGVLIVYGDNDTFPVWYMQMAENYREDIIAINESLSYSDWYREQILKRYPDLKADASKSGRAFIRSIIKNNWPERSMSFALGASPDDYAEFSEDMPLVGLARTLGMDKQAADSMLVANLARNYAYSEPKIRGQEANYHALWTYNYLAKMALGKEPSEEDRKILSECFDFEKNSTLPLHCKTQNRQK